jgi:AcrR family transcriptional regulator
MSRPSNQEGIKLAARRVFARQGYHSASIRAIAKEAGVSLSALYYYYEGKQEVLLALLQDSFAEYARHCERELRSADPDPVSQLSALVRATVRFRIDEQELSLVNLREIAFVEGPSEAAVKAEREKVKARFDAALQAGLEEGVFTTRDPADARRSIIAMCNSVAQWYDPHGTRTGEDVQEAFVRLALAMVGATSPGRNGQARSSRRVTKRSDVVGG